MQTADQLVGGPDAILAIDDTAMLKKGEHSVGVAPQYVGVRFGCVVADAGYGISAAFRRAE